MDLEGTHPLCLANISSRLTSYASAGTRNYEENILLVISTCALYPLYIPLHTCIYLPISRLLDLEKDLLPVLAVRQRPHDLMDPPSRLRVALLRRDRHDLVLRLLQLHAQPSKSPASTNGKGDTHLHVRELLHERLALRPAMLRVPPALPEPVAGQILEYERGRRERERLLGHCAVGHEMRVGP